MVLRGGALDFSRDFLPSDRDSSTGFLSEAFVDGEVGDAVGTSPGLGCPVRPPLSKGGPGFLQGFPVGQVSPSGKGLVMPL